MRRYALRDDQWDRIKDFLPGRAAMSTTPRQTIDCSSKRFCADTARRFLGAICRSVSRTGRSSISASAGGRTVAFSSVFSSCLRGITTTNTSLSSSRLCAHINTVLGRIKKRRASDRPMTRRTEPQNPRVRRCISRCDPRLELPLRGGSRRGSGVRCRAWCTAPETRAQDRLWRLFRIFFRSGRPSLGSRGRSGHRGRRRPTRSFAGLNLAAPE